MVVLITQHLTQLVVTEDTEVQLQQQQVAVAVVVI